MGLQVSEVSLFTQEEPENMYSWVNLDSGIHNLFVCQSTFGNEHIKKGQVLKLSTNAGERTTTQLADMPDFGKVWFDQEAITNIFTHADMKKRHRVTYDSDNKDAFVIYRDNGIIKLKKLENRL